MNLLFLHGAPASGKLTVAKALMRSIPCRLFDNHTAIDLAKTMFDFGAPGFWELTREMRLTALRSAAWHDVPLVITTFCYSASADGPVYSKIESLVQEHNGEVFPVFLHCSEEEAKRRIGNVDRVARGKLSSMEDLNNFRAYIKFTPLERNNCISLDTTTTPPEVTAQMIIKHFHLDEIEEELFE